MGNGALSLLLGTFVGTYFNNPKFRTQVDNSVKNLLGSGIDALNRMNGGEPNVAKPTEPEPAE